MIGGWVWPRDHDVVDHDKINETIDTKNYVLIKSQANACRDLSPIPHPYTGVNEISHIITMRLSGGI